LMTFSSARYTFSAARYCFIVVITIVVVVVLVVVPAIAMTGAPKESVASIAMVATLRVTNLFMTNLSKYKNKATERSFEFPVNRLNIRCEAVRLRATSRESKVAQVWSYKGIGAPNLAERGAD
jgi:hypothetical protein